MIEWLLIHLLLLLAGSLLYPPVFAAGWILLLFDMARQSSGLIPLLASFSLSLPTITTLQIFAYSTVVLKQGGELLMLLLVLLLVVPLLLYLYLVGGTSVAALDARLCKATNAMQIVYAVVLCLAAVKLISFAIPTSIIAVAAIFLVSLLLFRKTKLPLLVVLATGLLIAFLLV